VNGYFGIVSQSRAGAGEYMRQLQRYELHGHYECVRRARYREVEPGGSLQFVDDVLPVRGLGALHRTALSGSEQDAREARLRQLSDIPDPKDSPTVREFLRGVVTPVTVTRVVEGILDAAAAQKLVDELMDSLLVQPHSEGPFVGQAWSELSLALITAVVKRDPTFPRASRRLTP